MVQEIDVAAAAGERMLVLTTGGKSEQYVPSIIAALEVEGLMERAVYVSCATMREQRIVCDLHAGGPERGDCFAMVVVSLKERSGLLAGSVPLREVAG